MIVNLILDFINFMIEFSIEFYVHVCISVFNEVLCFYDIKCVAWCVFTAVYTSAYEWLVSFVCKCMVCYFSVSVFVNNIIN